MITGFDKGSGEETVRQTRCPDCGRLFELRYMNAPQSLYEQQRRDEHKTRLLGISRTFAEKYAPNDPRVRDVFYADLAKLLREVKMDALKPFHEAAAILWSIAHAAGCETKQDLMKAAKDALPDRARERDR